MKSAGEQHPANHVLAPDKKATPVVDRELPTSPHPTPPANAGVPSSRPKNLRAAQALALKGNKKANAQTVGQRLLDKFRLQSGGERGPLHDANTAYRWTIEGHGNTQAGTIDQSTHIHNHGVDASGAAPKSLWEITTILHPRAAHVPSSRVYASGEFAEQLRQASLIFISSADDTIALGAAYCLIDELSIEPDQRLLVDFDSAPAVKPNLHFFTPQIPGNERKPTAAVVDGFSEQASGFLDWLMAATETSAGQIRQQMRDSRLSVLCLVDESYFQTRVGNRRGINQTFATWKVPFLTPLLSHCFPEQSAELEQQIRKQQREGKWGKTDSELYKQIRHYLNNGELPRELEARTGAATPAEDPDLPQFKGSQSIEDTLLYVATHFTNLAPHEFDLVVSSLLAGKTTTVTVKSSRRNKDGETELIETEVEKPLLDFWGADPDKYLTACQLETVAGEDRGAIGAVIDFADSKWREELRARLEKRHGIYLMRQFQTVQQARLLFDAPQGIVANVMRLSVDLAVAHPDSFGKDWLFQLTQAGSNRIADSETARQRIPQLLRQMLAKPQLKETVDGLLKELMSCGAHESVLYIIRGLQFAPRFDEFLWLKRLLNEADEFVRIRTYYHLYGYIKRIGIYPLMSKLDAWLPTDERTSDSYSVSTMYALRLLVEYCSEMTESFDPRYYGLAQPVHPLLSFVDETAVRENLGRLLKWLFHPGMEIVFADLESVFEETGFDSFATPFVGELLVEWMFVLQGYRANANRNQVGADLPQRENRNQDASPATDSSIDAQTVRDTLITELARATNPLQRNQMLSYWERLRDFMAIILGLDRDSVDWIESPDHDERAAIRWRRELVRELIKRFRGAIREIQFAAPGTEVIPAERSVV